GSIFLKNSKESILVQGDITTKVDFDSILFANEDNWIIEKNGESKIISKTLEDIFYLKNVKILNAYKDFVLTLENKTLKLYDKNKNIIEIPAFINIVQLDENTLKIYTETGKSLMIGKKFKTKNIYNDIEKIGRNYIADTDKEFVIYNSVGKIVLTLDKNNLSKFNRGIVKKDDKKSTVYLFY
ncbi:MAG: hypothetical protein ACRCZI_15005, partial [Cetobacterium sp.]